MDNGDPFTVFFSKILGFRNRRFFSGKPNMGPHGTLGHWDPGTLGPWDTGTLGPWDPGTLGPWDPGTELLGTPGLWDPPGTLGRTLGPRGPHGLNSTNTFFFNAGQDLPTAL